VIDATEIRVGNVLRIDGKICKVITQEVRGTGKSGKTVQLKLKSVEDGRLIEKSFRSEDRAENVEVEHARMQYLYKDGGEYVFMHTGTFEQYSMQAAVIGRQEVFLKENLEINVFFAEGKPISIEFPRIAELEVSNTAPPVKSTDSNYKEAELENGLTILVPQFVKQGDRVRVNVDDLSYAERVTSKSV